MFHARNAVPAVLLITLFTLPVLAGPLKNAQVPVDAKWVVHGDLQHLRTTRIRQLVLSELMKEGLQQKLDGFKQIFGFDPTADLKSVTLYGSIFGDRQGIALIQCDYDRSALMNLLHLNSAHVEHSYKNHLIHQWEDKHVDYGCFYDEQLIVIGPNKTMVQTALDVLDGAAPNLTAGTPLAGLQAIPDGTFFHAAARGFDECVTGKPKAAVLKHADQLSFYLGERQERVFAEAFVLAPSVENANMIYQVLQGLIAFGSMAGENHPVLGDIAGDLRLSLADDMIQCTLEYPARDVFDFLKIMHEKKCPKEPSDTSEPVKG
jgi:hypothetical protein